MTRLGRLHDWWTRPCGGREVLQVSLPLVVSTISTTVMIFIDRMFLLWYAPKALSLPRRRPHRPQPSPPPKRLKIRGTSRRGDAWSRRTFAAGTSRM